MSAFRGFISRGSFKSSIEPHLQGDNFVTSSCVVPNSVQYSLRDLLASGQKLAPADTAILHDDAAIHSIMDNTASSVETSND
jgi:hypothetical protein